MFTHPFCWCPFKQANGISDIKIIHGIIQKMGIYCCILLSSFSICLILTSDTFWCVFAFAIVKVGFKYGALVVIKLSCLLFRSNRSLAELSYQDSKNKFSKLSFQPDFDCWICTFKLWTNHMSALLYSILFTPP